MRARWGAADESELCSQTARTSGVYGCSCHGQHRAYGATVARLTPDQKVGSSNLSALTFDVARRSRRRNAQTRIAPQLIYFATCFCQQHTTAGGSPLSPFRWSWVLKCAGAQHVLWIMSMAHPNQADRPQGSHHVSDGILVASDLDIGSGWQQSRQNWARPAVVGH